MQYIVSGVVHIGNPDEVAIESFLSHTQLSETQYLQRYSNLK